MTKKLYLLIALVALLVACQPASEEKIMENDQTLGQAIDTADRNNNFYDNVSSFSLPGDPIEIAGEIDNPGSIDFQGLPKRSVIVKEALLNEDGSNRFIGAYRYDGYSLFDILTNRILDKANKEEFPPIIDLYVEIENNSGEKAVLSWGEIFYPNILHQIIIATDVARIVPSKSKDLWPLPTERKLVVVNDLITERNISNPVKITVRSSTKKFDINRDLDPLWSPNITFELNNSTTNTTGTTSTTSSTSTTSTTGTTTTTTTTHTTNSTLSTLSILQNLPEQTLHTIFYGRGRGIHSTQPFTGYPLQQVLLKGITPDKKSLQKGLILISAADGYRVIFSLSEIINRNDQESILIIPVEEGENGGKYRLFPSCDFFSDRAVKAVTMIETR